ncbi:TetR/AcrR family transcriptional regulator [Streptomyces griseomycini]|uniref:AcrR family transcriptional regulator n=1 Tax=Streptomyces griseomycini TaxID=66895 RepID=A0A7W7M108_9ACTN|nr:TetR/AcrR family transcriptional regulator [Streptomyces griseomycini]MBB4899894.1 AcrR family transcriptional regulator [Streptomyces griseomycini]GGP96270.1 TetR family transcriptional regulator [Streptomyces griseomycini]GGR05899.1 TetR family transcriptional regulator [Streptomyces griseomycini]
MARVTQEHLDARRRQILDGAASCFARNGFHATSMQDVLKEVDLSAGAVYRYFSGKEELIAAVVTEVLDTVRGILERAARESPPPTPDVLIPRALARLREQRPAALDDGTWMFPRLMIQVWTETTRSPELAAVLGEGYRKVRTAWGEVVESYRDAGLLPADTDADAMARTMIALVQGYAAQMALFGGISEQTLGDGLRALMSVGRTARGA